MYVYLLGPEKHSLSSWPVKKQLNYTIIIHQIISNVNMNTNYFIFEQGKLELWLFSETLHFNRTICVNSDIYVHNSIKYIYIYIHIGTLKFFNT